MGFQDLSQFSTDERIEGAPPASPTPHPSAPPTAPRGADRQPILTAPPIVISTIGALLLAYVAMAMTPRANAFVIEYLFAVSPLRFLAEIGAARAPLEVTTLATHMLFHASLLHLGLNCVWLLAFGAPVARRLGQGGEGAFLALFILSGMAGALLYILMNAKSPLLLIGASGGVSGLLGAMVRFMFARGGAAPLFDRQVLIWSASVIVLNLMFGLFGGAIFGLGDSNIAWQAHVGGYVFGLLTAPLFLRMAWR